MAEHICPVWAGYFLASRLRTLLQNPYRILSPHVKPGMTVLDVGSAMGFFSLPMAEMVGPRGKVVCVDVQPGMLNVLARRAARAGLAQRIQTHVSREEAIGLQGYDNSFDFALAFAMLHEVQDPAHLLGEIYPLLKGGASLLLAEPAGHVTAPDFERTIGLAIGAGFAETGRPRIRLSHAAIMVKPAVEPGSAHTGPGGGV
jgi:2-polyprenyl-3-methyl-5-hydroxy-6-metoxy-1,4-benzoquinol methylase